MFRQRLLTAVSSGLLLLQAAPVSAQGYIDSSAYADAVMALSSTGVIDGGGNVRLDDYVNRAEALKIILKSQNRYASAIEKMQSSLPPQPLFVDVSQQEWYAPYLEVGFKYGLVKGYPDGRFWPNGGVKVVEAAAMLVRSYGDKSQSFVSSADLPNTQGQWFTDALSVINANGAVLPGSRLDPGAYMTRGQLFDMVYRMQVAKTGGRAVAQTPLPESLRGRSFSFPLPIRFSLEE